jgi:uncharacterized membrane protein YccC
MCALQVETTMSKAALRVLGTGVGSVLGWVLMLNTRSAANPFAVGGGTGFGGSQTHPVCTENAPYFC